MADILAKILEVKRREVQEARTKINDAAVAELAFVANRKNPVRGFARALRAKIEAGCSAVIAEVKKASPSKGLICRDFDPRSAAMSYEKHGAACLSVLTDVEFFQGSRQALEFARSSVAIPVLRKDFMIDPYQVYEARAWGADAVLVIMRALDDAEARDIATLAVELGMDVLVETHDAKEIERALQLPSALIGINNRNLNTFVTDVAQTLALKALVPDSRLLVSESGISTVNDVSRLEEAGVHAFLVGEAFMKTPEPGKALSELFAHAK
ncbi:MAG: indole-3-glycerol phosphate synthase TrpC [Duodenibacillus sp.]